VGRGQFLEAVTDDEDAAVPFHRPRPGRQRQEDGDRHRQGDPHRAAQPSHRPLCSAPGRRARLAPLLAAAIALALALPGCGSQAPAAPQPTDATTAGATESTPGGIAESASRGKPASPSPACSSHLTGFLDQLEHLRRSLVVGVSYEQYVSELGTVRRSYEQVPVGKLDLACVSGPANSAEQSFDTYLAAANTWGDCVSEAGCETSALEPKLRRRWQLAAQFLAEAKEALQSG
jgi:hypothetical protein